MIIDFKMPNVLDRIPLKHCFSNVNARRRGFSRGGGASRSESNESIAGGNRTADTSALRRELAAVSAPLEAASYRFSCRSKKTAAGGTQPKRGQGFRMKCFSFRAVNCLAVPTKSLYRPSSVTALWTAFFPPFLAGQERGPRRDPAEIRTGILFEVKGLSL